MYQTALAEQLPPNQAVAERPYLYAVPDIPEKPQVHSVKDVEFEPLALERFEQWIGSVAVPAAEVSEIGEEPADVNILERVRAAKSGDPEALKWLTVNVDTAIFEAVFKDDYVGATFMDRNEEGDLVQHGQTNSDIHHNAIALRPDRHPVLKAITKAEALNRHRIEAALEAGKLTDHYFVVFSLVPEGVPEEALGADGDGYFLDSLTLNIQATTEVPSGRVKTETAFMAGVEEKEDDTFDERLEKRYDFRAAAIVYKKLGLKPPDTAEGFLNGGALIPKDMMPNGVVDVMRWLGEAKAEVLGREDERSAEDYLGLRLKSKRREASLVSVRENVIDDLFDAANDLGTPMDGVDYLWDRVRVHATQDAFTNPNIDPKAFGRAAAPDIIKARHQLEKGNNRAAMEYMLRAHEQSVVAGCGGGAGSSGADASQGETPSSLEKIAGSDEFGSLAFVCPNGHLNIRPYNDKIPACQHQRCEAKVAC